MTLSTAVGVPVWNGEKYLETCVAALLSQSVPPDEILISDNASTDGTARIAAGLASSEPRVRVVRNDTNLGAAANYNRLVTETDSDLFGWAPYDDVWSETLIECAKRAFAADNDVVVAYGRTEYIDVRGDSDGAPEPAIWSDAHDPVTRFRELFADPVRSHLHVCTPVLGVMRRSVLEDTGLIQPFGGSDKVLIAELALRGRLTQVDAAFYRRRHAESSVRANPDAESRRRWFDSKAHGPAMPVSRLGFAFSRAVWSAPLGIRDRVQCGLVLGSWLLSGRRPLAVMSELAEWAKAESGRLRPTSSEGCEAPRVR